MGQFTLTLAQMSADRDVNANRQRAVELITQAGAYSDLVVLPENAMYSDPTKEGPESGYAEPIDGPFITAVQDAARAAGSHVVVGYTETSDDARAYNTLAHIGPDGAVVGVYRKVHLYDAFGYRESDTVRPADIAEPAIFEINGVRVGTATCYDLRFPEISRWLVDHGADVIVLPAAWAVGPMKELHWETLARARAIENTVYFAACGQTGPSCTGQSAIFDPMGVELACAGEANPSFASATVSSERIEQVRKTNPSLSNRRFTVQPKH